MSFCPNPRSPSLPSRDEQPMGRDRYPLSANQKIAEAGNRCSVSLLRFSLSLSLLRPLLDPNANREAPSMGTSVQPVKSKYFTIHKTVFKWSINLYYWAMFFNTFPLRMCTKNSPINLLLQESYQLLLALRLSLLYACFYSYFMSH